MKGRPQRDMKREGYYIEFEEKGEVEEGNLEGIQRGRAEEGPRESEAERVT